MVVVLDSGEKGESIAQNAVWCAKVECAQDVVVREGTVYPGDEIEILGEPK